MNATSRSSRGSSRAPRALRDTSSYFRLEWIGLPLAIGLLLISASTAGAADRDVQIRTVDFTTGVVELFNFGIADEDLGGWRFCTHDEDQTFRYSGSAGLNGVTIEAGTSIFIHFNGDSPGGSDNLDSSALGGFFATPLDHDAYGMGLYVNGVFGNGANLADHLQWSLDGIDNASADERSDEAQSGGVWLDQGDWIATTADSESIELTDLTGGVLHSPLDYQVNEPVAVPTIGPLGAAVLASAIASFAVWSLAQRRSRA